MQQPEGLTYTPLKEVKGLVLNVDRFDLTENFALRAMNVRMNRPGVIFERDDGTQHGFPDYPTGVRIINMYPIFIVKENAEYIVMVGLDASNNLRLYVRPGDGTGTWEELSRAVKLILDGTPAVATLTANIRTANPDEPKDILNNVLILAANELQYWIAVNIDRSINGVVSAVFLTGSGASSITSEVFLGSDGLGWQDGDDVYVYKMQGVFDVDEHTLTQFFQQGLRPHIRWLEITGQNKVNMLFGSSTKPAVMRTPVKIQKGVNTIAGVSAAAASEIFWYPTKIGVTPRSTLLFRGASGFINNEQYILEGAFLHSLGSLIQYYTVTTRPGWYVDRMQLIPNFKRLGEAAAPKFTGDSIQPYTTDIGEGIRVIASFEKDTAPEKWHTRFYVTALYRGTETDAVYQMSDVIYQLHLSATNEGFPQGRFDIGIDLARINKSIHGFRVYEAAKKDDAIGSNLANWFEDADQYVRVAEVLFSSPTWRQFLGEQYTYRTFIMVTRSQYDNATAGGQPTLLADMRHAPVTTRSYMTPRFAVKVDHSQGALVFMDQDDHTLRSSIYGGNGAHQDDNFPNVSVNIAQTKQRILLFGKGPMEGLGVVTGVIAVIRPTGLEYYDFTSKQQDRQDADMEAPDTLHTTPYGLFWLGRSGAYMIDQNGGPIQDISIDIQNLLDGTLKLDPPNESVPFLSDANRKLARAGYDPVYQQSWLELLLRKADNTGDEYVQMRFSWLRQNWSHRILNIGTAPEEVRAFAPSMLKYFLIAYGGGILRYPTRSGALPFEDDVAFNGTSANKGFTTDVLLNFGTLYELSKTSNLWELMFQWAGESADGQGYYLVEFFSNFRPLSYADMRVFLDQIKTRRGIDQRMGALSNIQMRIRIPDTQQLNTQRWDMQTISIGHIPKQREGTL